MPKSEVRPPRRSETASARVTKWRDDAVTASRQQYIVDQEPVTLDATKAAKEIEALRLRYKGARQEVEEQKQKRTSDAARMAERLSSLEDELAAVIVQAAAVRGTLSKERNCWRTTAVAAGTVALAALCAIGLLASSRTAPQQTTPASRANLAASSSSLRTRELPDDPHAAFTTAIDQLNDAIDAVPGRDPLETLLKVSRTEKGCTLIWNGRSPSVLFGGEPVRRNSIAYVLADCADAVERFSARAEADSQR